MREVRERIQIACLTSVDPLLHGRNSWAATLYYIARTLHERCGDVTLLGPMRAPIEQLAGKVLDVGFRVFSGQRYMSYHNGPVARRYARIGARRLAGRRFDVILSGGAVDVAYLETDTPIVLALDATHARVCQYYPAYSNLAARSCRDLETIERAGVQKAALLLYASTWAARSAIEDYHADPAKVHVVPFGADLAQVPPAAIASDRKRNERCRLLFLGVDWQRKGGDIAFETLCQLDELGVPAELIVCGCAPPRGVSHPRMQVIPFLNKRDERQREQLEELFRTSDFLLLPTRCECYGMVFCEAAAYGLPVVATRTGGVPEIVTEGENGVTLPLEARGDAYARVIARIHADEACYRHMAACGRRAFETRLNWEVWGDTAARLISGAIGRAAARPIPDENIAAGAGGTAPRRYR